MQDSEDDVQEFDVGDGGQALVGGVEPSVDEVVVSVAFGKNLFFGKLNCFYG